METRVSSSIIFN